MVPLEADARCMIHLALGCCASTIATMSSIMFKQINSRKFNLFIHASPFNKEPGDEINKPISKTTPTLWSFDRLRSLLKQSKDVDYKHEASSDLEQFI